jgi:hypothetical protein
LRRKKKLAANGYDFKDSLGPILQPDLDRFQVANSRVRIYLPQSVVFCELAAILSGEDTLSSAVIRNNQDRIEQGLPPASTSTASYSDARKRLPPQIFSETSHALVVHTLNRVGAHPLWGSLKPKAIDGSAITTDDTQKNQKKFPQHGKQKTGVGFPLIRAVLLQDLSTGMVENFAYGAFKGKETGEMALARQLLPGLKSGDMLLGDCYFPSYFLLADLLKKGVEGVFPMHFARQVDFRKGHQLHHLDHIVNWQKPVKPSWMSAQTYEQYPGEITLRELDISKEVSQRKETAERFVVVTSLLDDALYPKTTIAKFYQKRWQIELAFRDLKSTFHMEHVKAQSPEMVDKVIWAHILGYNVLRWHMLNASQLFEVPIEHVSVKTAARILTEAAHLIPKMKKKGASSHLLDALL